MGTPDAGILIRWWSSDAGGREGARRKAVAVRMPRRKWRRCGVSAFNSRTYCVREPPFPGDLRMGSAHPASREKREGCLTLSKVLPGMAS